MKNNEVEMILEPSITKPKPSDGNVVARPSGVARSERDSGGFRKRKMTIEKLFCAPRELAVALLEDLIQLAGAHDIVITDEIPEEITLEQAMQKYTNAQQLSANTQKFIIDLSDRLMIDCDLNENDVNDIITKMGARNR